MTVAAQADLGRPARPDPIAGRTCTFVALEYTHALGPQSGCYVVRGGSAEAAVGAAADVLAFYVAGPSTTFSAARARRHRRADPGASAPPVALNVAVHLHLGQSGDAASVAREALRSVDVQVRWVERAVSLVNAAIGAVRAELSDPYYTEVSVHDARTVRIGYGPAGDLIRGGWTEATEVTLRRPRRPGWVESSQLGDVVAAALGGRAVVHPVDEHRIRAILDLEQRRYAGANRELQIALELALADRELCGLDGSGRSVTELARHAARLRAVSGQGAASQCDESIDPEELWAVSGALSRILGRWRADKLRVAPARAITGNDVELTGGVSGGRR